MIDADTADLAARAAAGEGAALDRLVRGHRALVYRWALVLAEDPDDADDLAQAVWVKAYRNIERYRGDSKFTSWLYRITFNTSIELGRKRQRRKVAMTALTDIAMRTPPLTPPDRLDGLQLATVVRSLLADLPPRQRAVFALADLEDRTTAEIAEMLEIAEATVRVTLFKARRAIRSRMLQQQPKLSGEIRS